MNSKTNFIHRSRKSELQKKFNLIVLALLFLLCSMVTGCSGEDAASIFGDAMPEKITGIEVSGSCGGSELKPWELTQEEIEELNAWLPELSLKHRTYAEGEAPNEVWSGGASYRFDVNNGELSFNWIYIDKAYIWYNNEWYEITNTLTPPLGLAV